VVRPAHPAEEDLLKRGRNILLANVVHLVPKGRAIGAALMGVSEPTFRRWMQDLGTAPARTDRGETAAGGSVR